jgi:hypothetical protein
MIMAKAIATIGGTALVPGISKNRRLYPRSVIAGAVAAAQERIRGGGMPLTMKTHHGAEDSSDRVVGRLTSLTLGEDGAARFTADIADTPHGRTIASLIDTSDGQPAFLKGVSIRGAWTGKVRREKGPDDGPVETADGLELSGLDYTESPGVTGAGVDTFAWASGGQQETAERVLITESVEEAAVTFTEDAPDAPGGAEGEPDGTPPGDVTEAGGDTPAVSKRGSGLSGTGRVWADPGYQSDKKQRYDLSTKAKAKAAWSYINQAGNAAKYTATQLKRVKSRIKAALGRFGVKVAAEGWTVEPAAEVTEAVAEWFGSPETAGSYSITASNGPTNVSVSGYGLEPAELAAILTAACTGANAALAALDPDMDGDIDVPGAPDADTDHDMGKGGKGETAPEDETVTETTEPADAGDESPADAGTETGSEDPAMAEETTTGTGGATPTLAQVTEAIGAAMALAFETRDKAKADAEREAREAQERESAEKEARKTALAEALAELGIVPAAQGTPAPVAETTETAPATLTEADVERMAGDMFKQFVQEAHASGVLTPARNGLVVREHAIPTADEAPDTEALQKKSDDDLMNYLGGAMAQQADQDRPVGAR